jgi:membrane associated rhomboid family serine protease/tetratricopeptide (TPR) repeat protein
MELERLIIYILIANVAYMIFSLFLKGYKHYSGYIAQLFFLLCLMITLMAKGYDGWGAIGVSLCGIFGLVILPIFLQKQIDFLVAENRLDEIEPIARFKANIAWSELNVHLHKISEIASENHDNYRKIGVELRGLLDRGDPYDEMTRIFLGLIHFNSRNFTQMIADLEIAEKSFNEYTFEELLYLVRAYLETGDYERALKAQLAIEGTFTGEEFAPEKRANLVINRMIFLAFMGWYEEFSILIDAKEEGLERLPGGLLDFWTGVAIFNSGDFEGGKNKMAATISQNSNEAYENLLPFMRQRYHSLLENQNFFAEKLLPLLRMLKHEHSHKLNLTITEVESETENNKVTESATNVLSWLIMMVSISVMVARNTLDSINLMHMGAVQKYFVFEGQLYRLFNYQFLHLDWKHLLLNILALKYFGPGIETLCGWPVFLGIYFFSGICGGLATAYYGNLFTIGASASVLGLLSAAIIFQTFKIDGSKILIKRSNFSTLLFILGLNIILGLAEQIVDNSAHIGGLVGGAIAGLIFVIISKLKIPRKLASAFSLFFVAAIFIISCVQMYQIEGKGLQYPNNLLSQKFKTITNASETISLDIPTAWNFENANNEFSALGVVAKGPLREKLSGMINFGNDPAEKILNQFIEMKTNSFEKTKWTNLLSRKGPELAHINDKKVSHIRWEIETQDSIFIERDYFVFKEGYCFVLQFFILSKHDKVYDEVIKKIVQNVKLGNKLSKLIEEN